MEEHGVYLEKKTATTEKEIEKLDRSRRRKKTHFGLGKGGPGRNGKESRRETF